MTLTTINAGYWSVIITTKCGDNCALEISLKWLLIKKHFPVMPFGYKCSEKPLKFICTVRKIVNLVVKSKV